MRIFADVAAASADARNVRRRRVLVPTMGALHRGHLELIRIAREHAGADGEVAVSIFVNPLQFEPGSDFSKYPRPETVDEELCRNAAVDVLFRPRVEQMYASDRSVYIDEALLSEGLCGKSRPGHFRGVCTVVAKLFHVLAPDAAVFGEKDFQQLAIIRRLVRDLNFSVEVIAAPTVREVDGLALSSRNHYLNKEERQQAATLHAALRLAATLVEEGECSAGAILLRAREKIAQAPLARIDYLEIVDGETLQPIEQVAPGSRIALAVSFGKTRLIDNMRLA